MDVDGAVRGVKQGGAGARNLAPEGRKHLGQGIDLPLLHFLRAAFMEFLIPRRSITVEICGAGGRILPLAKGALLVPRALTDSVQVRVRLASPSLTDGRLSEYITDRLGV